MLKKIIEVGNMMDEVRFFPRLMMLCYTWLLFSTTSWFMTLTDPSNAQAGLISVITAGAAGLFTAYVNSGKKK